MASQHNQVENLNRLTYNTSHSHSPTTDINILLMGETGTGKTTFINSFLNYLIHNTLDDVLNGKLHVLIPSSFTFMPRESFKEETVFVGNCSAANAESNTSGQSATRSCRSYIFKVGNRRIRFIDVPGVGDTRNIDQDAINVEQILNFTSQYEYLNGVCIFIKANETRMTVSFRYCIKETLRQLHVSAAKNIMFVFTYSQSSDYEPGEAANLIGTIVQELKASTNVDVPFNKGNSFFFDNGAFRFVAVAKQGITQSMSKKEEMKTSWQKSVDESYRMLEVILTRDLYAVEDIRSLAQAKELMSQLARPITEAIKLIESNTTMAETYKSQISKDPSNSRNGSMPQADVQFVPVNKRLTVCINPSCTRVVKIDRELKVEYYKYCHDGCHLNNVVQESIGHPILKKCSSMTPEGICKNCGCKWQQHMHVTYQLEKVARIWGLFKKGSSCTPKEILILINQRIDDLRKESKTIQELCVKLSIFIKKNSLVSFNDEIINYLQLALREAEQTTGQQSAEVNRIRALIEKYEQELKLYKIEPNQKETDMYVNQNELKQFFEDATQLYELPISGEMIRMQLDRIKQGKANLTPKQEIYADVPIPISGSEFFSKLATLVDLH